MVFSVTFGVQEDCSLTYGICLYTANAFDRSLIYWLICGKCIASMHDMRSCSQICQPIINQIAVFIVKGGLITVLSVIIVHILVNSICLLLGIHSVMLALYDLVLPFHLIVALFSNIRLSGVVHIAGITCVIGISIVGLTLGMLVCAIPVLATVGTFIAWLGVAVLLGVTKLPTPLALWLV